MGNKNNKTIKLSRLKKKNFAKQRCSKMVRNKNGSFLQINSTEDQQSCDDTSSNSQISFITLEPVDFLQLQPSTTDARKALLRMNNTQDQAATQSTDVNVQDVPGSSTSAPDPLAISKPTHETDEGDDRLVIKMENEEDNFQPISERFTTTAGASSQHQTATAHSFRRTSSYSSYASTPLVMDLNEPSRSETVDIKPVINSWLSLNATSSPMLEVNPLSLHNEDSSSSNAFRADENSSFFQFFRAIHSDFQELSAKRQRQFKKKCLDYLHELMDEEENDRQQGCFHQDNMNLSNSVHMSEEERDVKPVVKDGFVLSSN